MSAKAEKKANRKKRLQEKDHRETADPQSDQRQKWTTFDQYSKCSAKCNKKAEPYLLIWNSQHNKDKIQNLHVMRSIFLGPFLYGIQTLCEDALEEAITGALLPRSGLWPPFYDYKDLRKLESFLLIVEYALRALESDPHFIPFTLTDYGMSRGEAEANTIGYFRHICPDLKELIDFDELKTGVRVVRIQLKYFIVNLKEGGAYYLITLFRQKQDEHNDVVETIKERGNKNTRDTKYRAAIADYTRALKINPYNEVLYCNRAICYLKCNEFWMACVDSQRAFCLRPDYEKAYYRCVESYMHMGEMRYAAIMSQVARRLCRKSADLLRQNKEIKDIWQKAAGGSAEVLKEYKIKVEDLVRGYPEVNPVGETSEQVLKAEKLGLIFDVLPKVTLFRGIAKPEPHLADLKKLEDKKGKDKGSVGAIRKLEINTDVDNGPRKKVETHRDPGESTALKRIFKTLFEMDAGKQESSRYGGPKGFDLASINESMSKGGSCDIALPDGRRMTVESLDHKTGYVAVRIERRIDRGSDSD